MKESCDTIASDDPLQEESLDLALPFGGRDLLGTQNRTVYSVIKKIRSDSPG